jgi:hypothetical protein
MLALRTMRILAGKMDLLFCGPNAKAGFQSDTSIASLDPLTPPMFEVFKTSRRGEAALALNPKPAFGFTSAADPELLPEPKPRAIREHFVVPSVSGRDVAWAEWPYVRRFEHFV